MTPFRAKVAFILLLIASFTTIPPVLADSVVGNGTPASCTSAAIQTAIDTAGGIITFNCGGSPITIPVTATLNVDSMTGAKNITIDGGDLVTLDGGGLRRIFYQRTWGFAPSAANSLTLKNITIANGHVGGSGTAANGAGIESINQSANSQQEGVPTLIINNVTFTNNDSAGSSGGDYGGGAIYSSAGIVTVTDSTFINNDAANGGGGAIHILRSDLTITGSTFTTNSAIGSGQGGAIYVDGYWTPAHNLSIATSTFDSNTTWQGGGAIYINMYDNTNQFTVDRTTFHNNAVIGGTRAQGGAISGGSTTNGANTGNAIATITNSTFDGNSVKKSGSPADGSGGAISFNQKAVITIANSTFFGNTAYGTSYGSNGGAVAIGGNTTPWKIINTTIADNHSGWVGGGLAADNLSGTLSNTIIANNTADYLAGFDQQCSNEFMDNGHNFMYPPRTSNANYYNETSCFQGKSAVSQRGLPDFRDPMLDTSLGNNGGPTQTLALLTGSPAIDDADNTVCAASPINNLDQRGFTRPVDGDGTGGPTCDSGAFEFVANQPAIAPPLLTPADNASTNSNMVTFTWDYGGFATSYHLQVDNDSNFSSPKVDISGLTGISYTVPYLGVGVYHWRVQATNTFGSAFSGSRTLNINSTPNAAPPLHDFTTASQTLTWNRVLGATGYQIEIATNSAFTGGTFYTTAASQLSKTVSLTDGIYYWRVHALEADGVTYSAWSGTETITVNTP